MKTIWAKGKETEKNCSVAFVCTTELNNEKSVLEIVAANIYRLFINGEMIGYGPARTSHGYIRRDTYDLSKYIGIKIIIVVEVFGSNVNSYYVVDEPPFFGANLTADGKIIASTNQDDFKTFLLTDRITKVQRYSLQRPFAEAYIMEKCRSNFYHGDFSVFPQVEAVEVKSNKVIDRNIAYPEFNFKRFEQEIEFGTVAINPQNPKWKHPQIHQIDNMIRGYPDEELEICLSDEVCAFDYQVDGEMSREQTIKGNSYKVFDFGRTLTGFFSLKLTAAKKSDIYIIWDEIIWSEEKPKQQAKNICFYRNTCYNIIKYTLEKGEYDLLAFEAATARFVKIIVMDGEIELNDLKVVLYENDNVYKLKFECEDQKLEAVVEAAANTLAQNAVDVLTDCPSRERAGWLCDSYFSGRSEKLFTGKNEIEKNFLENYHLAPQLKQLPDGMIPMCYPGDHYNGIYIPNWAMFYILELKDYFRRTGDNELIEKSRQNVFGLVDFFSNYLNEDGLLEDLESWVFVEWSRSNDEDNLKGVNYPCNMLYSKTLIAAGELYGDESLIKQGIKMKEEIIRQSYNGKFFEDNRIRENGKLESHGHTTETCQYYAFYFGIADKESFPKLFDVLFNEFGPNRDCKTTYPDVYKSNAFIGNYLRLECLLRNGRKAQVIDECKDFFYFMAQRTGTLWEHSYASGSLNHGFASFAANLIIECVTGFVEADNITKTIYLAKPAIECNAKVKIPVAENYFTIQIKDGNIETDQPKGYSVQYINN